LNVLIKMKIDLFIIDNNIYLLSTNFIL
jgi:hypothetical protein